MEFSSFSSHHYGSIRGSACPTCHRYYGVNKEKWFSHRCYQMPTLPHLLIGCCPYIPFYAWTVSDMSLGRSCTVFHRHWGFNLHLPNIIHDFFRISGSYSLPVPSSLNSISFGRDNYDTWQPFCPQQYNLLICTRAAWCLFSWVMGLSRLCVALFSLGMVCVRNPVSVSSGYWSQNCTDTRTHKCSGLSHKYMRCTCNLFTSSCYFKSID